MVKNEKNVDRSGFFREARRCRDPALQHFSCFFFQIGVE